MAKLYTVSLDSKKKVARPIVTYAKIFKRVLDIIPIKIRHLKGENKWKNRSRRLDPNGSDIGVH